VLPCLFHRLLLGAEAFELFGGFVLTAEKVALAQPLALGKPFLSWRSLRSTAAASCDDSAAGVSAGAVTSMA
jgi:hypothetical protein